VFISQVESSPFDRLRFRNVRLALEFSFEQNQKWKETFNMYSSRNLHLAPFYIYRVVFFSRRMAKSFCRVFIRRGKKNKGKQKGYKDEPELNSTELNSR
jgi:hypothetical protein